MSTVTQGQVRTQPPAQLDSRMLAGGVDLNDYLILKKRSGDGEDWVEVAEELGDKRAQYARAQLALPRLAQRDPLLARCCGWRPWRLGWLVMEYAQEQQP